MCLSSGPFYFNDNIPLYPPDWYESANSFSLFVLAYISSPWCLCDVTVMFSPSENIREGNAIIISHNKLQRPVDLWKAQSRFFDRSLVKPRYFSWWGHISDTFTNWKKEIIQLSHKSSQFHKINRVIGEDPRNASVTSSESVPTLTLIQTGSLWLYAWLCHEMETFFA